MKVVKRIIMSSFDIHSVSQYDIALIQLSEPFVLSASVERIAITTKDPEPDQLCITTGWSTKSENGM